MINRIYVAFAAVVEMRKYLALVIFSLFFFTILKAQSDTQYIKDIYDRALDFDESKIDSFDYCIGIIEKRSRELAFDKGEILSSRLKGIKAELSGEYENAISYYLRCLDLSRQNNLEAYESSALSDLGIIYTIVKNPNKAKIYYKLAAELSEQRGEVNSFITHLTNLGGIYNQLHEADSALLYLNKAQEVISRYPGFNDLASLRNNFGNAWFSKREWNKSLPYFQMNFTEDLKNGDKNQLWYDVLNMGDVFIEMRRFDSADYYLKYAGQLATELNSKRKEADVYTLCAKYFERKKNFKAAYESLQKWNSIDTSLVNKETRETIVQMEERFHAKQREQQNKLLLTEIEAERLKTRQLLLLALTIGGIALASGIFLSLIRQKNKKLEEKNTLIQLQNKKLAELNMEKNSLISIVSHDLSTPFVSIRMWNQLLESNRSNLNEEQLKAVERIKSSLDNGEALIRNILAVEKEEVNQGTIQLEEVELSLVLEETVLEQTISAEKKDILLNLSASKDMKPLLTDKRLVKRVFDNLLSNAIKFSPRGKQVFIETGDADQHVWISFRDEGPGIPFQEQENLFDKYTKASTRPTAGELSTGLGLSIVKRILEELNGEVTCQSEEGKGSVFTVYLQK